MKEKKKLSDFGSYEMDEPSAAFKYDDYDFSDGSTNSGGLNDDVYTDDDSDDDDEAEKQRKQDRANRRAQTKQAAAAPPSGGGLEALMAQAPTRNKSIGIHGEREISPVPRTRPTAPLRSRSGGIMKLNRKISRTVADAGKSVVGAATIVADVARGREEISEIGELVRSSSLVALTRKITSRAERKAAKEEGMGNLSLETEPKQQGKLRESSIGALSRRSRRTKSVDDAMDLEAEFGEMDLNAQSPMNSPMRQQNSSKPRRCKSVDDAEGLLDMDGEFELNLKDDDEKATAPKKKERKRTNSVGAVDTKTRRERKKSVEPERKARSKSRDDSDDEAAEKKTKKKTKSGKSVASNDSDSDNDEAKKTKRKVKRGTSKASSDSSEEDADKKTKRKVKRSTSVASDGSSDGGGSVRSKRGKPRKKASKSPKLDKKKSTKKVLDNEEPSEPSKDSLDLGGGPVRRRGVARRSSLGSNGALEMQSAAQAILQRTQQADQRFMNHGEDVIERRVRRRASLGVGESMRAPMGGG